MGKNIWIINQYLTTPELNGDGYRHAYLADFFKSQGYDVTLITSSFSHVPKKNIRFNGIYKIIDNDTRTLIIKGISYNNSKGINRVLSWVMFSFLLFFIPKKKLPIPDYIIVSSMSILPVINVVFDFKRRYPKVNFIFEIRDIWPLTIVELGNYSNNNLFVKFLSWIEKIGYKEADHIVSVLINADKHIKNILGHDNFKFTWISNGYSINTSYEKEEINEYLNGKIPKNKFIVGYAGTLGKANAMKYIVRAMEGMDEKVCLCILGSGNEKQQLIEMNRSDNIIFLDKVPKSQVLPFLKRCDLLYLGWYNSKIYNFGVSAQKIFDYMFAGKPILMSGEFLDNPISKGKCGFVVPAENSEKLRESIISISQIDKTELDKIGNAGREYLLGNFTYDKLAQKYTTEVFDAE